MTVTGCWQFIKRTGYKMWQFIWS